MGKAQQRARSQEVMINTVETICGCKKIVRVILFLYEDDED